jgi:hypothetical protein
MTPNFDAVSQIGRTSDRMHAGEARGVVTGKFARRMLRKHGLRRRVLREARQALATRTLPALAAA